MSGWAPPPTRNAFTRTEGEVAKAIRTDERRRLAKLLNAAADDNCTCDDGYTCGAHQTLVDTGLINTGQEYQ